MELEEKQDRSIVYWLQDIFSSFPTITVVDGYPTGELSLPTISVESEPITIVPFELGNRAGSWNRLWAIDVYGNSKTQRDFMAYRILNYAQSGIPVYNYDEGFPPSVSPTQIGSLSVIPDSLTGTPIRVFPELVEKLYWRFRVRFLTEYSRIV